MSALVASPAVQDKVQALQRTLYRAAKADPGRRFHALYDKVHRRDVLERAWVQVRLNSGAPGIDRQTIKQVEDDYGVTRLLDELAADLREHRYRPMPARRVWIPKPGSIEQRPLSIPAVRDRIVQAATKIVIEPIFGVSWRSCRGLTGESPVQVMAKQPGSWWPAEGETQLSKRHDKVPLGGKQTTSPYVEEPCSLVRFALREQGQVWEPSPSKMGEGHGRREDLGLAAPMDPPGYGGRNGRTAHDGTGEIRLGTGMTVAGCQPVTPGSGETYKQRSCEVVERRAEVGGGHSSDDDWDNRTRSERRASSRVCSASWERLRACSSEPFTRPPCLGGSVQYRNVLLGPFVNAMAQRNAVVDCPVESRMRENLMSGSGRGSWKRSSPSGPLRVPGRCAEKRHFDDLVGTQPVGSLPPRQLPTSQADFQPASFGFRPKRSAHDALQVLIDEAWRGRRWVVETDIASCFEAIPHDRLMKTIEERILDRQLLKLIASMLRAGVMEDGEVRSAVTGTPQGGVASPLLCNVYLNRLDRAWKAKGVGRLVRYADDSVTRTQGGIDVEDRTRQAVLCQRWRKALRDRPAGGGPKPPQAASVKSRGGERCGQGAPRARQVRAEKASGSEPPMTCRKRIDDIETGRESFSRDEPGGYLSTAQAVSGIKAARAQLRLWCGTCEPVAPMPSARCNGASSPWPQKGAPQVAGTTRGRVPMRSTGAGRLAVAMKPGNAGGAKGAGHLGVAGGQP